jgi:hypothetical protein
MGLIWYFVLLPVSYGFLSIFVEQDWPGVHEADELCDRARRGQTVVALASVGILIAWSFQLLFRRFNSRRTGCWRWDRDSPGVSELTVAG